MTSARVRRAGFVAVLVLIGSNTPVAATAARKAAVVSVSASPSAAVARVGQRVVVRGVVRGDESAEVRLQRRAGRSWVTVGSATTSATGAYSLIVPTGDAEVARYRVLTAPSETSPATASRAFTVGVGFGEPTSYSFLTSPPVRWDPCGTIGYRVNVTGAPEGAVADIRRAVDLASAASGLDFEYRGTTKVVPGARSANALNAYPADTELVIAYTRPDGTQLLKNRENILGVGGVFYDLTPQKVGRNTWYQAVQGYVVLNSTKDLPGGFGPGREVGELGTWGQVIMHEVAHTLGLDHPKVEDEAQIMNPRTTYKEARWGAGDLTALRRVGAVSGCFAPAKGGTAGGAPNAMVAGHAR